MSCNLFKPFVLLLLTLLGISCQTGQKKEVPSLGEWPEITKEARPWTRWWWMGNAVDSENIDYLLGIYSDAGLGGVEIAPIYGAREYEDRYLEFLSEAWMEMLEATVAKANELGMGVDLTQGTGWPFGGPQVDTEHAASKLVIQEYNYNPENPQINIAYHKRNQRELDGILLAVIAYSENGEAIDISDKLDETGLLSWDESAPYKIKAVFLGKTGQMVKRAAPGGAGFTLDHYSGEAVNAYLNHFDNAFGNQYPSFRSFYNDSFEVYGADFTGAFFEEFERRRGYDLKLHLPELLMEDGGQKSIRVKSDYRETLHELLLANFTEKWTTWAHSKGKLTKNQAHGSPGNLLDLYGAVDIPECETFGSSFFPIEGLRRDSADIRNVDPDPIMLKFASSAAHLTGKTLVSSETFTWLGEHFKTSFSQMKPELDQVFLSGVNHVFYHGVTYSPKDVAFPGWLFYASLNLTQHNSLWAHFREFNDYISRTQAILQSGKPDNELLIYWPVYDVWANPKGMMEMITVHHIDQWLHPSAFYQASKSLIEKGYSLDFISDAMIAKSHVKDNGILPYPEANPAKALLIPKSDYMPLSTLDNILKLAEAGARVIFQAKPGDVPGLNAMENGKKQIDTLWEKLGLDNPGQETVWGKGKVMLSANFARSLESDGIVREKLVDSGLSFIRRSSGSDTYYFLVNHSPKVVDQSIKLSLVAPTVLIMDPLTGKTGKAHSRKGGDYTDVKVKLEPGESLILRAGDLDAKGLPAWNYLEELEGEFEIPGPWQLTFDPQGGPEIPDNASMEIIAPWTALPDPKAAYYSGRGTYSTDFEFDTVGNQKYILGFDQLHESAKVWVNGEYAGQVWSLPYRLDITGFLKNGQNHIQIEVANLMANHIRYLDQRNIPWRNYHEINFVNIDYQPFDASGWDVMLSGISGAVRIYAFGL